MKRRVFGLVGLALSLSGVAPFLAGCEELHHGLKARSDDQARVEPGEDEEEPKDKVLDVQSERKPFFKSTRLSGALSDEGRDIERSLGVN